MDDKQLIDQIRKEVGDKGQWATIPAHRALFLISVIDRLALRLAEARGDSEIRYE